MIELIGMVIALIFVIFILFVFFPTAFGAPFQPTSNRELNWIIELANAKKSDKIADMGSGNGKIIIEFAKRGIEAHGYEINPFLVWWSRQRIKMKGLQNKAFIYHKDFWKAEINQYDIITLFQINYAMPKLRKKIEKEGKKNVRIVSNTWKFHGKKPIKKIKHVYLYKFK